MLRVTSFSLFTKRSYTENFTKTLHYKNNLAFPVQFISILFLSVIHFIEPVRKILGKEILTEKDFFISLAAVFAAVMWFVLYKTDPGKIR
jgi:ABC-type uncharacterized transport system permease subunit